MEQSIMMKYIDDSQVITKKIFQDSQIGEIASKLDLKTVKRIIFVGSGSSDNAALVNKLEFEKNTGFEVTNYTPEQFVEAEISAEVSEVLTVFISATGNSRWTDLALEYAKKKGYKTIAISATPNSLFSKKADVFIDLLSGDENSYAKTKGYNATLLTIHLLGLEIGKITQQIDTETYNYEREKIQLDLNEVASTIARTKEYVTNNLNWALAPHITVLGNKVHYGSAQELSLKLTETRNIPTKHANISEFVHGTHRGISKNSHIIVILTDESQNEVIETIYGLEQIAEKVLVINGTTIKFKDQIVINNPQKLDMVLSVSNAGQILASMIPEIIGINTNSKINEDLVTRAYAQVNNRLDT